MPNEDIQRIYKKLEEISEKVAGIGVTCPAREKRLDDIEKRLREQEAFRNKSLGIFAIVSIIIGSIGAFIFSVIKKFLAVQ